MAKDFRKKSPLDKLSGTSKDNEMQDYVKKEQENENKDQVKKRPGRPRTKTEETRTINIAVPISVLERMNIAKICYEKLTEHKRKCHFQNSR